MRAAIWMIAMVLGCAARPQPPPGVPPSAVAKPPELDEATAARLSELALACVHREYPNKLSHVLHGDDDVKPPRELTPAFFGCFDWHSAVHGHWMLARLARTFPDAAFAGRAREALARSLTESTLAGELAYVGSEGRAGFERPYGLAWLLQLGAELRQWDDDDARHWAGLLAPLEEVAAKRLRTWLSRLSGPIRVGEHSQTAFAMGLALDWARAAGDAGLEGVLVARARDFHGSDSACPIAFEPSGHDFLSPCLAAADLMRRVLEPKAFVTWLSEALPRIPEGLEPAVPADRSDGKLAHLDGLNLSRAWMLEGIASGLPPGDRRVAALMAAARSHRDAGLDAVTGEHYAGGHWLGSFATYLTTGRGLAAD